MSSPGQDGQALSLAGHDAMTTFAVNLMEHLVVPTFVLDAQCKVQIWNKACERLTGIAASEVIGTSGHWRAFYDSPRPCLADLIVQGRIDETGNLYAEHIEAAELGHGLRAENWCVMPRVGTRLYLAIDAGPIYDESGHLIAVIETLRDMTVQKDAQAALEALAARDSLTSLANRRTFDATFNAEWRRGVREGSIMSLLMIDVDRFKDFNDQYGHPAGDECLKRVAGAIARQMQRASDFVARYGGEEFVVILPGVTLEGAKDVAARIGAAVEALGIAHGRSSVADHVTVSIGVSTIMPSKRAASALLLDSADAALYQAKNEGRNRLIGRALDI